jgi:hypothetical protein
MRFATAAVGCCAWSWPDSPVIAVEDEGPGIPDGEKEAMIEPFVRGDIARGMEGRSGFGRGPSIARALRSYMGIANPARSKATGLIARIELQRAPHLNAKPQAGCTVTGPAVNFGSPNLFVSTARRACWAGSGSPIMVWNVESAGLVGPAFHG